MFDVKKLFIRFGCKYNEKKLKSKQNENNFSDSTVLQFLCYGEIHPPPHKDEAVHLCVASRALHAQTLSITRI